MGKTCVCIGTICIFNVEFNSLMKSNHLFQSLSNVWLQNDEQKYSYLSLKN